MFYHVQMSRVHELIFSGILHFSKALYEYSFAQAVALIKLSDLNETSISIRFFYMTQVISACCSKVDDRYFRGKTLRNLTLKFF